MERRGRGKGGKKRSDNVEMEAEGEKLGIDEGREA